MVYHFGGDTPITPFFNSHEKNFILVWHGVFMDILVNGNLTIEDIVKVSRGDSNAILPKESEAKILKSREYVDNLGEKVVYGINTGFGEFSKVVIDSDKLGKLQTNLIISHACGVGNNLPTDVVKAIMLLRANSLCGGYSGVRLILVKTLLNALNAGIVPCVPEKGSLGASGDLAPLSHLILPILGLGEAYYKGTLVSGKEAMELAGIDIIRLSAKEGLALINGTQVMTAIGALTLYDAKNLLKLSDISAALTIEALNGITDAFNPKLHALRPHTGQSNTAQNLLNILQGSERTTLQGQLRVQDAYTLRCIPQIHGASKDAINYIESVINTEINSVTDNPIIIDEFAISGGHFHGQPVALAMDFMAIALSEIANVSERRIERLVNPSLSGLPAFLTEEGGLNSGFMIAQYTAASLVSENKVLSHPASVDSIPSSANQEDHVSMGTIAARKARDIYYNASRVIAIELLSACQAIDLSKNFANKKLGKGTAVAYDVIRNVATKLKEDREMYLDINKVASLIDANKIVEEVEKAVGILK